MKDFVKYDLALKLKEKGFDEPCIWFYNSDISHCNGYLCELAIHCKRYKLFLRWQAMGVANPYTPFANVQYDKRKNDCPMFLKDK